MSSTKRKMPSVGLQRRVRPRFEPEPESNIENSDSEAPSEEDVAPESGSGGDDDDDEEDDDEEDASDGSDGDASVSPTQKQLRRPSI